MKWVPAITFTAPTSFWTTTTRSVDARSSRKVRVSRCAAAVALALSLPDATAAEQGPAAWLPDSIVIENCDDSGPGSLRDAVTGAASGDMIDLSQLTCSTITLTSGAIEIPQDDLYLKYSGEGGTPPTIDGNLAGRVFHHTGYGTLRLVGLTISNGKYDNTSLYNPVHPRGGCIYSSGNVYLAGSTVTGCIAKDTRGEDAAGGGIYAVQAVTLSHSVVSSNTASSTARYASGGGVFAHGAVDVEYGSVSGNVASGLGYLNFGGGICIINAGSDPSLIANSIIDGNRADRGGALFVSGTGTSGAAVSVIDSTISGNTANSYAAAAYTHGPVTIANSTIAFNVSNAGPAVEFTSNIYQVEVESSILSNNEDAAREYDVGDRGADLTIVGANNLIMFASSSIMLPADTLSVDPMLQPLAENGGPTRTHALGDGSPAIDTGNDLSSGLFTDQRGTGYPRVHGAAADIGAFEAQFGDDTIFANGFDP
jgi:hypothetical protein